MPTASKQLFQVQLGSSNGTLYTAPSANGARARIRNLTICNTDTSARTVTLDIVPSGGSAGASVRVLSAAAIPASTTWLLNRLELHVEPGGTVQGLADAASKITVTGDGEEMT